MRNNPKYFTEFRDKDYRLPRSMREAYGYDPVIYDATPTKFELPPTIIGILVVAWLSVVYWTVLLVVRWM